MIMPNLIKMTFKSILIDKEELIDLSFGFLSFNLWGLCPQIPRQRVCTLWNPI